MCLAGIAPTIVAMSGGEVASSVRAAGWGLWLPGAGFLAIGGWWMLVFPIVLRLAFLLVTVWAMTGFLAPLVLLWGGAVIAAYFAAAGSISVYGQLAVPICVAALYVRSEWQRRKDVQRVAATRRRRESYLDAAAARHERRMVETQAAADRHELDRDDLRAARYIFDLALQPVGAFDGFTRIDNIQLAALRYQLNYISYALAQMQMRYTPSFHGYLNEAQRFAIESLARPEVCGYWKYEYLLGNFGWNPDPVGTRDNIMLTGWSAIALTTYAANTGDLRYQDRGALKFTPFASFKTAYAHDTHSFAHSILWNWQESRTFLYPCEPHWTFSICNTLAICSLFPYDRVNGSDHGRTNSKPFLEMLESEFVRADGSIVAAASALTGLHRFSRSNPKLDLPGLLSNANYGNALHPGLALRSYLIIREELARMKEGALALPMPLGNLLDLGNYKKSPGYALAGIAQAAAEHGDEEVRLAALTKAESVLKRAADTEKIHYQGVSATTNIRLANARWARRNDWHDLIHRGVALEALSGPILAECRYPDVLVARAVNDGVKLELVLYNGREAGAQRLRIERLAADALYDVTFGDQGRVRSDDRGVLEIDVRLDGRTEITLFPAMV